MVHPILLNEDTLMDLAFISTSLEAKYFHSEDDILRPGFPVLVHAVFQHMAASGHCTNKDVTNMAQCTTAGSDIQRISCRRDSTSLDLDKAFDVTDVMCIVHCTKEGTLKFTFK